MAARKIEAWHKAGLIDAATRDALLAHEDAHARPVALWAVFGIGALAIGLGLISVVAANWEAIPAQLRLGVHFALIAGALAGLVLGAERLARVSPAMPEALLFIAGALGLSFFGHLGQVYQTSSPLWQPLGLWLVMFAPILLMMGQSWLVAASVMGACIWGAWDYADNALRFVSGADMSLGHALWLALVTAAPVLMAPLAAWLRGRSVRRAFWRRLEQAALAYGVAGASFVCAAAGMGGLRGEALAAEPAMLLRGAIGIAAGAALAWARPGISGRMAGAIIAGAGAAMMLALALASLPSGRDVAGALLFMALWAGIGAAALAAGWRGVFQLAVSVIALRLIILSFELASDLLLSGFGLIISGLLIVGVGWAALVISRRFAPPAEGTA